MLKRSKGQGRFGNYFNFLKIVTQSIKAQTLHNQLFFFIHRVIKYIQKRYLWGAEGEVPRHYLRCHEPKEDITKTSTTSRFPKKEQIFLDGMEEDEEASESRATTTPEKSKREGIAMRKNAASLAKGGESRTTTTRDPTNNNAAHPHTT